MSRVLLLPTPALAQYQHKRVANLRGLGPALRLDTFLDATELAALATSGDWMAVHPWRQGWVPLDHAGAEALIAGRPPAAFAELGWLAGDDVELAGLTRRAIRDFAALQNPFELTAFLTRVAARRPRTIVEIGTSAGGLLFAVAQLAADDAVLISIDLPDPTDPPAVRAAIPKLLHALVRPSQQLTTLRESSTSYSVLDDVRGFLAGRAVDLLIIDGDHSYGIVRSDFEMYSPLVAPGGLVAFHDVLITPENSGRGLDVNLYWRELGAKYRVETIADPDGVPGVASQRHTAPAARKRAALGWGLLEPR